MALLPPPLEWIPQVQYAPARARGGFTPANPILFSVNGVPGISVSQAVAEQYTGLDRRDDPISAFGTARIICRIQVGITALCTNNSPTLSPVHQP